MNREEQIRQEVTEETLGAPVRPSASKKDGIDWLGVFEAYYVEPDYDDGFDTEYEGLVVKDDAVVIEKTDSGRAVWGTHHGEKVVVVTIHTQYHSGVAAVYKVPSNYDWSQLGIEQSQKTTLQVTNSNQNNETVDGSVKRYQMDNWKFKQMNRRAKRQADYDYLKSLFVVYGTKTAPEPEELTEDDIYPLYLAEAVFQGIQDTNYNLEFIEDALWYNPGALKRGIILRNRYKTVEGERWSFGLTPKTFPAIVSYRVSAGYIATSEAFRMRGIVEKN